MGWADGTQVFNRVARVIIEAGEVHDDTTPRILGELADALADAGWDTIDESIDEFRDCPEIVAVLRRASGDVDIAGRWLGTLGYDDGGDQWVLSCDEHGVIGRGDGQSVEEHDRLVRLWAEHDEGAHGGDGRVDERMLINRTR